MSFISITTASNTHVRSHLFSIFTVRDLFLARFANNYYNRACTLHGVIVAATVGAIVAPTGCL